MFTILATGSYLLLQSLPANAYYKKVDEKVSFVDANAKCNEVYGTDMASIHSNDDFDRALETCGAAGPCWLGGIHGDPITYEISKDFSVNNWQWIDGSEWDYSNWIPFNGVEQGKGLTGEYFTCLWERWDQGSGAGLSDCGSGSGELYYPICKAPNPIKCEQTQGCAGQTLVSENIYCTGYRACVGTNIRAKRLFVQGIRAVEGLSQITAENIYCFGQAGAPSALMNSNGIEKMNAYFYGFECGANARVHCADGSICNIFCDGKGGCNQLSISYDDDSTINVFPAECGEQDNQNKIINNIRCPKEIINSLL